MIAASYVDVKHDDLPAGMEWRRADELRPGDVLKRITGHALIVESVSVKPRTVWIVAAATVTGGRHNGTVFERINLRPHRDDHFQIEARA